MVNREIIRRKLEKLESNLGKLDFFVKRGSNVEDFLQTTEEMKSLVEELKAYIEYEPRSANEINTSIN
jgi:hypothetical protein